MRSLSSSVFQQADAILDAALDLAPGDRHAFAARACEGHEALARVVQRLLRAHEREHGVLDGDAAALAAAMRHETPRVPPPAAGPQTPPSAIPPLGPYHVRERLGAGGLGVVYLATREDGESLFAVKVLRDGALVSGEPLRRFLLERHLLARVSHAHVARLIDRGMTADGAPYLVMPYYTGGTLAARLATGCLPMADVLRLSRQVAEALAAAHADGVLHRDVKPSNVLLDEQGDAFLSDFGIARLLESHTQSSTLVGTLAYVAPEQLHGRAADVHTDLWAFGVMLYEMVTGKRPFAGTTHAALLHGIATLSPALPVRDGTFVPPALQALLQHLLEKDPAERPAGMADVVAALAALQHDPTAPYAGRRPPHGSAAIRATLAPAAVLVLPLVNASGDADDDPWCAALTADLIACLSRLRGVRVTSRTTAYAMHGRLRSRQEWQATLGVTFALEGTVHRERDVLRVVVALGYLPDGSTPWSATYERPVAECFATQGDIVRAIVDQLVPHLTPHLAPHLAPHGSASRAPARKPAPRDPRAQEAFLRGRFLWERRAPGDARRAQQYFEEAVATDPSFADAHAGIADALLLSVTFGGQPPDTVLPRVRALVSEALRLGPDSPGVRATRANLLSAYDWQWEAAEAECRRALELDPTHSAAQLYLAIHLQHAERSAEAIAVARNALQSDPLSGPLQMTLGRAYMHAGQLAAAIPPLRAAVELTPGSLYALRQLGDALLLSGATHEALHTLQSAVDIGGYAERGHLAYALGCSGERDRATVILHHLLAQAHTEYVSPYAIAMAYAGLGRADEAIRWLQRGVAGRAAMMNTIAVTPVFAALREHPEFPALRRAIGLPDVARRGTQP